MYVSYFKQLILILILCLPLQLSQQLDGLLGMLCADVAPADGASIQQNLKLLEEKLQTVGPCSKWEIMLIFLFNSIVKW